jgi:Uma2 family endonuclease
MTIAVTAPRPAATYADIEALPPHVTGEIIAGVLHTQPRPRAGHGAASGALNSFLTTAFQFGRGGPGGWVFVIEPELHFGTDVVVPDIAGWRTERAHFSEDDAFITIAPDWVCEVLSPRTELIDRGPKRRIYAREGVGHLWLVDPRAKLIEAFANTAGHWLLTGTASGETDIAFPPFEAAPFPLPLLWPLSRTVPPDAEDGA